MVRIKPGAIDGHIALAGYRFLPVKTDRFFVLIPWQWGEREEKR